MKRAAKIAIAVVAFALSGASAYVLWRVFQMWLVFRHFH